MPGMRAGFIRMVSPGGCSGISPLTAEFRRMRAGLKPEYRIVFPPVFSDLFAGRFIYRGRGRLET